MALLNSLMKMSDYEESTEAIRFQVNSSFPLELEKIYDSVFAVSKAYDEEHPPVVGDTARIYDKHTKLYEFITKDAGPRILKTIEKHTNFKVKKIVSAIPADYDAAFSVYIAFDDCEDIEDIVQAIALAEGQAASVSSSQLVEKIQNMSKSLDRVHGKLGKIVNLNTFIGMPVGVFVVEDMIGSAGRDLQMTAKEITAITLHEVGHAITMVEHMGDMGYLGYFGNSVFNELAHVVKKDPKQAALDFAEMSAQSSKSASNKTDKVLLYNLSILLRKAAGKVVEADTGEDDQSIEYKPGDYKRGVIGTVIVALVMLVFNIKMAIMYMAIFMILPETGQLYNRRSSRDYITKRVASMYERVADEHVSRYGLSKDLMSALNKLEMSFNEIRKSGLLVPLYDVRVRENLFVRMFSTLSTLPNTLLTQFVKYRAGEFFETYEDDYTRLKRAIMNNYDVLKDKNIPNEVRQQIIEDIDDMEKLIANIKSSREPSVVKSITSKILSLPSIALQSPVYLFGSAKLDKEYFRFFEGVDELLSNKSAYYAGKIDNLFTNRG